MNKKDLKNLSQDLNLVNNHEAAAAEKSGTFAPSMNVQSSLDVQTKASTKKDLNNVLKKEHNSLNNLLRTFTQCQEGSQAAEFMNLHAVEKKHFTFDFVRDSFPYFTDANGKKKLAKVVTLKEGFDPLMSYGAFCGDSLTTVEASEPTPVQFINEKSGLIKTLAPIETFTFMQVLGKVAKRVATDRIKAQKAIKEAAQQKAKEQKEADKKAA